MQVRLCPRCGAPLAPAAVGSVESCRFCGVQGVAGETLEPRPSLPAIAEDEDAAKLCARYVASVQAWVLHEPGADEPLMRAIEWECQIPESGRSDFRRQITNYMGALAIEGKTFGLGMNKRLDAAIANLLERAR